MKMRLFLSCVLFFLCDLQAVQAQKISFWDEQKVGGNSFNKIPKESWFKEAQDARLQWVRLTFSKWKSAQGGAFLLGNADEYQGLVPEDLATLKQALGWAEKYNIKIVLAPLTLPGSRYSQHNGNVYDDRLWNDTKYWDQSAAYWKDLAQALKNEPSIVGYNILNEPAPEKNTGLEEHHIPGLSDHYLGWYEEFKGSSHDLPAFYEQVIAAIREGDQTVPIMLDSGWYGQPAAFSYWSKIKDPFVLYSFHLYEPYRFTNHKNYNNGKGQTYFYPGSVLFAGQQYDWSKETLKSYLSPFFSWAEQKGIPSSRLVAGEFGCYRRNKGCDQYLKDVIEILDDQKVHWAFYSFREDEWDGYDYEVKGDLGWKYWEAKEAGQEIDFPRTENALWDIIEQRLQAQP